MSLVWWEWRYGRTLWTGARLHIRRGTSWWISALWLSRNQPVSGSSSVCRSLWSAARTGAIHAGKFHFHACTHGYTTVHLGSTYSFDRAIGEGQHTTNTDSHDRFLDTSTSIVIGSCSFFWRRPIEIFSARFRLCTARAIILSKDVCLFVDPFVTLRHCVKTK